MRVRFRSNRFVRSVLLALVACSLYFVPASAQTPTTDVRILVYRNVDTPLNFNYNVDTCAANIHMAIYWKPDNAPYTIFVDRYTPNVSGVQRMAYDVCASPVASFSGPGTLTIKDIDSTVATNIHGPVHLENFGNRLVILRITAESGE